ncbi:MAG: hypothetical protein O3C21_20290, partial [Verrucomicrobia bacterium]|nr:hypothetical protein [Verrucomicrobiota bacterium]
PPANFRAPSGSMDSSHLERELELASMGHFEVGRFRDLSEIDGDRDPVIVCSQSARSTLFSIIVDSNHAADDILSMQAITESDQCIVLEGVSWDGYVRIDEVLGESRSVRLKFADDRLEIMSPSRSHEHIKSNIGRMI